MLSSFIHFHSLDLLDLDLYHYDGNDLLEKCSISLTALSQNLSESSNCIVFLPSQLFGSQSYSNDLSLKDVGDEKRLKSGDILICSTGVGTLGRVAQYKLNDTSATVDSHVTIVRPNADIF